MRRLAFLALLMPVVALATGAQRLLMVSRVGPVTCATPTFSPVAGTYVGTQTVTFSSTTPSVVFCSTSDGSDPAASTPGTCSAGATGATRSVAASATVKVLATKSGAVNSAVASAAYTINAAVVNLVQKSQALATAPWGTSPYGLTVTNNAAAAPDSTTTATLLQKNTTADNAVQSQAITLVNATQYTLSFYVLAGTSTQLEWMVSTGGTPAWTGEILSGPGSMASSGAAWVRGSITGLSTSLWTRVRYTFTSAATSSTLYFYPDLSTSTTNGRSVYLWGVQLETGGTANTYTANL